MDLEYIKQRAIEGESEQVEFKKSTADLTGACESLCGMLNAGVYGQVFIGVSNGKIIGQEVTDRTQQEVARSLKEFAPDPHIHFFTLPLERNRKVIVLTGKSQADHLPYFFRGKAYLRVGTPTSVISRDRLKALFMDQHRRFHPYDGLASVEHTLDDLDPEWIMRTVELGIISNRLPITARGRPEDFLSKFELIQGTRPTHAAVILFGKQGSRIPLQCTLMMARFKGTEKGEFLDHKQFVGNAFELMNEGMTFLYRHIPLRGRFEKNNIQRIDEPVIPSEALREALLNAICHRDYEHPGSSIHLAIYDDRVEIVSSGGFMPGIQASDLKKPHHSILRNRLIAQVFYSVGYIEKWGQGTLKIAQYCSDFHLPEPEYFDHPLWVGVKIRAPIAPKIEAKFGLDPKLRQDQILEILRTHKMLSSKDFKNMLPELSQRTLQRELAALKEKDLVEIQGRGTSSTLWVFKEE